MASSVTERLAGLVGGLAIKAPVRVATTATITLSGEQTIDGVAVVTDDRVLVKNQAADVDNGIYVASTSTWARAKDWNGSLDAGDGTLVFVRAGSVNAGLLYQSVAATAAITVGTTDVTFTVALSFGTFGIMGALIAATDTAAEVLALIGALAAIGNGADIASAGTVNLTTATGYIVDITGTTTITAITLTEGAWRLVRFTGILTLTHGASLDLPTSANITTAAGDWALFVGDASSVVRCAFYQRKSGRALLATLANTDLPVGSIIGKGYAEYTANADLAATPPADDTAPLISEGTQILSVSAAALTSTNKLRARVTGFASNSATSNVITISLHLGGDAVRSCGLTTGLTSGLIPFALEYEYTPGDTASKTFTVRAGGSGGTSRLNGNSAGRFYGGAAAVTLKVEEEVAA